MMWRLALALFACALSSCGRGETPAPVKDGGSSAGAGQAAAHTFLEWMNIGRARLDAGDGPAAAEAFRAALDETPGSLEARANLGLALLRADDAAGAIAAAEEALAVDPRDAVAHYVIGCANNRLRNAEAAVRALSESIAVAPDVAAAHFQLGLAYREWGRREEAVAAWRRVIELEPDHITAHYTLGQVLAQLGQRAEAQRELARHQEIRSALEGAPEPDPWTLERCVHTWARIPAAPNRPPAARPLSFEDVTTAVLGADDALAALLAAGDLDGDGKPDLVGRAPDGSLVLVVDGVMRSAEEPAPGQALLADLDNDGALDAVGFGPEGLEVRRGPLAEPGSRTVVADFAVTTCIAVDVDHTGKLDLLAVDAATGRLRLLRNDGQASFEERTEEAGLTELTGRVLDVIAADWDGDGLVDVLVAREEAPIALLRNRFRGRLEPVEEQGTASWPVARSIAVNDVDNDLRMDLVTVTGDGRLVVVSGGGGAPVEIAADAGAGAAGPRLLDVDADGWLDVVVTGAPARAWRNAGAGRFEPLDLGLDLARDLLAADFDGDGARELVTAGAGGAKAWRAAPGAHNLLRLHLVGTRSNRSALGVTVEVRQGRFRAARAVHALPVEIGVGARSEVDSVVVLWSDQILQSVPEVAVTDGPVTLEEPLVSTASCPFFYAWDGHGFRFVGDFLGVSPLGLRGADDFFIPADVDEYAFIGTTENTRPRDGRYVVQLTEELREVLYLDEAKLVAVDHPAGTEVHSTDRLRAPPFPPGEVVPVSGRIALTEATVDGRDVTPSLLFIDDDYVSPPRLRRPQLRGLAEPWSVTLEFERMPAGGAPALVLTGWLMWGGATANVGASHDAGLPSPFPVLEWGGEDGAWHAIDVVVGAPAGRTKSIVVELAGRLPEGARRLRVTTGFEIHWDRIALFDDARGEAIIATSLAPDTADLHHRGVWRLAPRSPDQPIRSIYGEPADRVPWPRVPSGWFTRYGDVGPLIADRDDRLALLTCGDELTLEVDAARLPALPDGWRRDFFLFTVGWDKDADYHVEHGWTVRPLPFHGMDDQRYGREARPDHLDESWIEEYNTRWVGPRTR